MDGIRQLAEKHENNTANKGQIIMRYEKGSMELNACALRTQNSQPKEHNFSYRNPPLFDLMMLCRKV